MFLRRKSSTSRVPSETETVVCFNKHSSRRCPGRFISQRRDAQARTCAKVAFLSIIITGDDYRKGQRPLTISDNRPDNREKLFLRRIGSDTRRVLYAHTRKSREENRALVRNGETAKTRRDETRQVAGVFATSIYSDYSGGARDRQQIETAINSINRSVQR